MPPEPLHEGMNVECFKGATKLQLVPPKDQQSRMDVQPSSTFTKFSGAYSDSYKTPDLIILAEDDDTSMIPRIVLEVGTSESYNHLKQSAKM